MASLIARRALGPVLGVACVVGCDAASGTGQVELELYDEPVECEPASGECRSIVTEGAVRPEPLESWVLVSPDISRFDPAGLYLYFEARRASGAVASVELDVSTASGATEARYVELAGGNPTFESESGRGRIEVPQDPMGEDCDCADGRFELVFTDPGPDGLSDTADDQVRRLSRARFGWSDDCLPRDVLPVASSQIEVHVVNRCPAPPRSTPREPEPSRISEPPDETASCDSSDSGSSCASSDSSSDSGCGGDSSSDSSSGCEGDSSSGSSGGGCEGDSSGGGCSGDSSGGGCEGDSSGGGCSGDSGGGGCDPDADRGARTVVGASILSLPRGWRSVLSNGRFQLVLFVGLALLSLGRRTRRGLASRARRDRA